MLSDQHELKSYYRARAVEYDQVYLKPERQNDLFKIRDWLPSKFREANVLEVACGTGYWTQFVAPVASAMLAIDIAEETLAIAKSRIGNDRVVFQIGDAYDLPKDRGAFDAAFAGFWFSHIPKSRWREFLQDLSSCLQPNAKVVLLDNLYVEGSSSAITDRDSEGNTYQTRKLADGSGHKILKNFPSKNEMLQVTNGIGSNPQFTCWQYYWAFEYLNIRP
jgi:ubiquinone/menaquinone biosynthesis C-methylase UbiE